MHSPRRFATVLTPLFVLGTMCALGACSLTLGTRTAATETRIVADVCRAWSATSYSSHDTAQTQREVRANNAARTAFGC